MSMAKHDTIDEFCDCKLCADRTTEMYYLAGSCSNCGWDGRGKFRKGDKPPYRGECPDCGCRTVAYGPLPRRERLQSGKSGDATKS